jgi:hypothetical protein
MALVYHRIGKPAGDARCELVPALDTGIFEAQLDHLRANYRVVPPSAIVVSGSLGALGIVVPAVLSRWQRKHERDPHRRGGRCAALHIEAP